MKKDHDNNFNLLRFLFASLVIVSHTPEIQDGSREHEILTNIFGTISFGELAVDSFFILSGYLILKSWIDRPQILTFLSSRILRIYPGFIAACLICALIVGPQYSTSHYWDEFHWQQFTLGLAKLNLAGIPAVFPDQPYPQLNGSLWSIPFEFKCYLLVLLFGIAKLFTKKWTWLLVFFICVTAHIANRSGLANLPFDRYFRCIMAFSAGGIFFLYREKFPWNWKIACLFLIPLFICMFFLPLAEPAICTFWAYLIIHYANHGKLFRRFNSFPDVSYGIYLYAWPINKIIFWYYPQLNVYLAMGLVFFCSIVFGAASWYTVEKPFMKMKKYFRSRSSDLQTV